MILALTAILAGFQGAAAPLVIENVEPDARLVSIQLLARIPRLTARQADALDALVDDIPREVDGYTRRDMMTVTNGDPVRVLAGPDYIRISFSVAPANWRIGLSLAEALAKDSKLTPPEHPVIEHPNAWTSALRPYLRGRAPNPGDIEELYRALFRPDNLTLGIGGTLTPGKAEADWQERMSNWSVPRRLPPLPLVQYPALMTKNPGGLDTLELAGPTFGAVDAAMPTRVLALFALGSGKGASLFRIARQRLGYSYRQEALLYPVPEGWQSRLLLEMKPGTDLTAHAEALRSALLDDVKNWSEADRMRALGMADGVLTRGVDFTPFAFGPFGTFQSTLEGRTFLSTYWQLKTGQPWDASAFLASMRQVRLEDLKDSATELLTRSTVRALPST